MPYETAVHLFHDQTEADEGDRSKQREGWPAATVGSTRPRWREALKDGQKNTEFGAVRGQRDTP